MTEVQEAHADNPATTPTDGLSDAPGESSVRHSPRSALRSRGWYRLLIEAFGIGGFYFVVVVYFSAQVPDFLSSETIQTVLAGATVLGIVALGQTYTIVSGGFDLSVGGIVALGAVVFGELLGSIGFVPAIFAAVALGALIGVVNGLIIARIKINALITTLAMLSIAGGAAYIISDGQTTTLTEGGFWGDTTVFELQHGTIALALLAVCATLVLRYTVYGRSIYAIGGNHEAALLAGLRVDSLTVSVYSVSGACSAFAGVVAASQLLAASPTIGADTTLNSIAAVVLGGAALGGGVGGIPGSILGVLLLGTTTAGLGLMQVASFYQTVVTGGVLLVAVLFARIREVLASDLSRGSASM